MLDQTTKALPPYTWITRMQTVSAMVAPAPGQPNNGPVTLDTDSTGAPTVRVSIDGRTVDIQAYTTFLRQLAASPWFTDVTPASSQTVIEADRPVTAFNVTVRYRVADFLAQPRWALGFLQSTRHFHDTAELRQLPRTIRERRIPS